MEVESQFNYEVSKVKLGSGSSGVVFLAQHSVTHELVAVKRLYMRGPPECIKASRRRGYESRCNDIIRARDGYSVVTGAAADLLSGDPRCERGSTPPSRKFYLAAQKDTSLHRSTKTDSERTACVDRSFPATGCVPQLPCEYASMKYLGPHPHIVRFFGNCTDVNGISFFAMELMDSDLGKELNAGNRGFMTEEVIRPLLYGVASAIAHLHERNVAHRDVKPNNILLKYTGYSASGGCGNGQLNDCNGKGNTVNHHGITHQMEDVHSVGSPRERHVKAVLGDFSTAHFTSQVEGGSGICGTLYYKSPEQLLGRAKDFLACDMWALGCTMFEMITGSAAFRGSTDLQVFHQICARLGTNLQNYPRHTDSQAMFDGISNASPQFIDLLRGLLTLDPCERLKAPEVLAHPFFSSLCEGSKDTREWTFPMRILCGVPAGLVQLARFKPIVCRRTDRSGAAKIGDCTGTKFGTARSDVQLARTRPNSDLWPSFLGSSPSPFQRSSVRLPSEGYEDPHLHFSSNISCQKKSSVARRLSISSCSTAVHGGAARKQEDCTGALSISTSLVALNFSPIPSIAKCHGTTSADRSFSPHSTHASTLDSTHLKPITARSSRSVVTRNVYSDIPLDSTFASSGCQVPRRVLFVDDTLDGNDLDESVSFMLHTSGDSPRVCKALFQ